MSINNGPSIKQNSNSDAQAATQQPQPSWMNIEEAIEILALLQANKSYDLFFELIKQVSFEVISAISVRLFRKQHFQTLHTLRSNKKSLWSHYLAELHKMYPSVPLNPPSDIPEAKKQTWHYHTVMKASRVIYQRQNEEIAYLKARFSCHKRFVDIDTQDINLEEITLRLLISRLSGPKLTCRVIHSICTALE